MNLISLPHPNNLLTVELLDYRNPYDFKTPHRHDYFEIILVKNGGGKQIIDFTETNLKSNTIYVIYPRQIHLLRRDKSQGLLIQFRREIFEFIFPLQHHHLYFSHANLDLNKDKFDYLYHITENILSLNNIEKSSSFSIYKSYSYLKILLITLIECQEQKSDNNLQNFRGHFLQLVSQNIKEKRKVTDYANMMHISSEKLTSLCKNSFGITPLKIIHQELITEIKRSILLGNKSLKEISFDLNFESFSNFSLFVKNATKQSPSELKKELQTKTNL